MGQELFWTHGNQEEADAAPEGNSTLAALSAGVDVSPSSPEHSRVAQLEAKLAALEAENRAFKDDIRVLEERDAVWRAFQARAAAAMQT